jgi:hypothetical protein
VHEPPFESLARNLYVGFGPNRNIR